MECITSGRVIVNGDDFGMSPGINAAIKRLHTAGRLSSVSIMSNMPWSADALAYAREADDLQAGAHLNLTTGRPLSAVEQVPSLVDESGDFLELGILLRRSLAGRVSRDELRLELDAQLARCLDEGPEIHHVDSHMHFHAVPSFGRLVADLAGRHGVETVRNPDFGAFIMPPPNEISPVRKALHKAGARVLISTQRVLNSRNIALTGPEPNARQLIYLRYCLELGDDPAAAFRHCLCDLDFGRLEIIAHPAVVDEVLPSLTGYVQGRELELEFLASDTFRELMEETEWEKYGTGRNPKLRGFKRSAVELDFNLYRVDVPIPGLAGDDLSVIDIRPEGVEQTIVFLHGFAGCAETWEHQINYFSHEYRVIAPDLRGHGQSDAPFTRYTMGELVADLYRISQYLELPEKFALVGHSFGGSIAVEYASAHPEQISHLVLIATAVEWPVPRIASFFFRLPVAFFRPWWPYRGRWNCEVHTFKRTRVIRMGSWRGTY